MKLFPVVLFCVLNLCFSPLSNCFFLRNPINWFRSGNPNSAKNEIESNTQNTTFTEQMVSRPETPTKTNEQRLPFMPIQPIQLQPVQQLQPLTVNQPMQPYIGVPIKMNRFGLEPLPYPLKRIPSKYPAFDSSHFNSHQNLNINRRFGDIKEDSSIHSSIKSTKNSVNQEFNPTEEYFSSFESKKENRDNSIVKQNIQNSYQTEEEISDINTKESSPIPVYIPSTPSSTTSSTTVSIPSTIVSTFVLSTDKSDGITSEATGSTTKYKPSFLHREDFASQLNNMYYNKPDIFQPMMNQFNTKDI